MKQENTFSNKLNPIKNNSSKNAKKDSIFQLIVVACQRYKQLTDGADPRVELPSLKTKKTKIAIEEVNQGLINFSTAA